MQKLVSALIYKGMSEVRNIVWLVNNRIFSLHYLCLTQSHMLIYWHIL